jgi:hypothetical protein
MRTDTFKNNRQTLLFGEMLKKSDSTTISFIRLRLRNAVLIGAVAAVLCFIPSCKNTATNVTVANSDSNSNSTNTSPTFDGGKYKELLDKKAEFARLSPPLKLDPKAIIKGKVLVAGNLESSEETGVSSGLSRDRMASSLDELETLIQIVCSKGKFLGNYEKGVKGYASDCKVSLIDFRSPAVIAQKTFSNSEREELIPERKVKDGEYLTPHATGDIANYINGFQTDKVIAPVLHDEKELLRIPVTVNLNPNAAIKGKIMIAQRKDYGAIGPREQSTTFSGNGLYHGLPGDKFSVKPDELETLIKIVCMKGSLIGKVENTTEYSSKCEVSLIDYKTLNVFAQKTFENKTLDQNVRKEKYPLDWVVKMPEEEIENYLKSFPTA